MSTDQRKIGNRDERLEDLARALKEAQMLLLQQSARLDAVTGTDEAPQRELEDLRARLEAVTAERDQLQERLVAMERMQIETTVLPDDEGSELGADEALPSIDELMRDLDSMPEREQAHGPAHRFDGPSAEVPDDEWVEMIPPDVIAPEDAAGRAPGRTKGPAAEALRLLVIADIGEPVKVPLHEGTMTIGRSETAGIRLDGQYVSRIHARIVCSAEQAVIEDAGSRNGFKVNSTPAKRRVLSHGDVITIGHRHITFVDTGAPR